MDQVSTPRHQSVLTSPLSLRGVNLRNRIMISPMCTYSAVHGMLDDFHLVHLGRFAMGGAGLVFIEATAVSERGRITHGCAGLWRDEQVAPVRRVADSLHRYGSAAGIQLSHAGHKGASQRPWEGAGPLTAVEIARGDNPWEPEGVCAVPFDDGWATPREMSDADIEAVIAQFADAARRADAAGIDVVEIHCAHGYLLHSFLSPISNTRQDRWGGDLAGRMQFPLEVVRAVRAAWPSEKPIFTRISSVDGIDVGWSMEDSVVFARELKVLGVDVVDCSSGGMKLPRPQNFLWRGPGFHVPFAERLRKEVDVPTVAVGLIRSAEQAEQILAEGRADIIAVGREALFHPNWAAEAVLRLDGVDGWDTWPEQFGWWLLRRAKQEKDGYGERKLA